MMAKVDLHTHTLASDGALTPAALVERAHAQGVQCLAVTDHDTCAGLKEAAQACAELGIRFIPGIELSTQWDGVGIHVVGLNINAASEAMLEAVDFQTRARSQRAEEIGERLTKRKMPGVYEKALEIADYAQIGRPHFAKAMVKMGYVVSEQDAFSRYLGSGKIGDIKCHWPALDQVVEWIRGSGGTAVLAHPGKYDMTWAKLRRFLDVFVAAGGEAMEISYGSENTDRLMQLCKMANQHHLKASVGSDFHSPKYHWTEVGKIPLIRGDYDPVWAGWI
ncbi:MAG: PHP domain-containing protein [Motiliproteus sp.]